MAKKKTETIEPSAGFKLPDGPYRYWWPCTIRRPADGAFAIHKVDVEFELLALDELGDLMKLYMRYADVGELVRSVRGWKPEQIDLGQGPLAVTDANKARLLGIPFVRQGIHDSFMASLVGLEEKN